MEVSGSPGGNVGFVRAGGSVCGLAGDSVIVLSDGPSTAVV